MCPPLIPWLTDQQTVDAVNNKKPAPGDQKVDNSNNDYVDKDDNNPDRSKKNLSPIRRVISGKQKIICNFYTAPIVKFWCHSVSLSVCLALYVCIKEKVKVKGM